jgi:hypothetical protein
VNFEEEGFPSSWSIGSQSGGGHEIISDMSGIVPGSTRAFKASYPVPEGGQYVWMGIDVSDLKTKHVAVEFWARMPSTTKHGLKFVKVFGKRVGSNTANATFGLDYTGIDYGSMYAINFGDGSSETNDAQNIIKFDGTNPEWVGRSRSVAIIETPQNSRWPSSAWGDDWHHFKLRVKFNSGTTKEDEVADGEFYVEIDGKVYVNAKNIFNRHYSNGDIASVEFGGWSQTGTSEFEVWYDNILVTADGFIDQPVMTNGVTKVID